MSPLFLVAKTSKFSIICYFFDFLGRTIKTYVFDFKEVIS